MQKDCIFLQLFTYISYSFTQQVVVVIEHLEQNMIHVFRKKWHFTKHT